MVHEEPDPVKESATVEEEDSQQPQQPKRSAHPSGHETDDAAGGVQSTLRTSAWANRPTRPQPPNSVTWQDLKHKRWKNREAQMNRANAEYQAALEETKAAEDAKGKAVGAWNVVRGAFMKGTTHALAATTRGMDSAVERVEQMRFNRLFPELADSKLEGIFSCQALHEGMPISGSLFITSTHVCYHNTGTIKFAAELADVVSVVLSVSLLTYDARPYLVPNPADEVVADALAVYVKDKRLLELVHIGPDTVEAAAEATNSDYKYNQAARMAHAVLYNAWATVVEEVPLPDVQYSDA